MSKGNKPNKTKTIVGYVDMINEDDEDAGIVITTEDDVYLVEMNKAGRRLMDVIGEKVQAIGAIADDDEYDYRISVSKFEIIEYDEDDEDYDGDNYRYDD